MDYVNILQRALDQERSVIKTPLRIYVCDQDNLRFSRQGLDIELIILNDKAMGVHIQNAVGNLGWFQLVNDGLMPMKKYGYMTTDYGIGFLRSRQEFLNNLIKESCLDLASVTRAH